LYRPDQGVIANSTVSVTDTGWHHVVATKSGADVHLYLDGVDVTGAVTNRTLANSTSVLRIGGDGSAYFSGSVDEVAIYGSVLSQAQVQNHYGIGSGAPDTSPPSISLTSPANGGSSSNTSPVFSGVAGVAPGDLAAVSVKVYAGSSVSGSPLESLAASAAADGSYSVAALPALAVGTYTAQAEQSDSWGNLGQSAAATFSVTADTTAPVVSLAQPLNGSSGANASPTFSGGAGTAAGDLASVTVKVYSGSDTTGLVVETLPASVAAGAYSVVASPALSAGTYTAQAQQADSSGNVGLSSANTFTVTLPPSAYRDVVLADSPVAYWRLGEASGTQAAALAGPAGVYHGGFTLAQAGPLVADGDTAVGLDGSSGYVEAPGGAQVYNVADGPLTLEAWVKRASTNHTDVIVHRGTNAYQLRYTVANQLAFQKANVATIATSTRTVTDTGWHYVAVTKNGSDVHLYLDGADVTGTVSNQTLADADATATLHATFKMHP